MIANNAPDPRLAFDPAALGLSEPPRRFFRGGTAGVARALIGAYVARRWRGRWYGARIVETEAYLGAPDRAAHSWAGRRTARVEPMYAEGGHLYVFLVYGMHHCANVVTRREGVGEAVLLRAAEPPEGLAHRLLSGPGKLCAALGITTRDSGRDLLGGGPVRIFRRRGPKPEIAVSPRVGVDYAGEPRSKNRRGQSRASPAVSGPRLPEATFRRRGAPRRS